MKKLIVIFFNIMTFFSYGQRDSTDNNNFVSFHFFELGLLDTKFSYEHKINWHHGILFDLGYKFSVYDRMYDADYSLTKGLRNYDYKGYNISLGYNYYLKTYDYERQCYFSGMFMFYKKYRDNFLTVGGSDGSYGYGLESVQQNINEFKVLFGCRTTDHKIKRKNVEFFSEYYLGFGIRNREIIETSYAYSGGSDPRPLLSQIHFIYFDKPIIESIKKCLIRPCFGVKFGIGWNKNRERYS